MRGLKPGDIIEESSFPEKDRWQFLVLGSESYASRPGCGYLKELPGGKYLVDGIPWSNLKENELNSITVAGAT